MTIDYSDAMESLFWMMSCATFAIIWRACYYLYTMSMKNYHASIMSYRRFIKLTHFTFCPDVCVWGGAGGCWEPLSGFSRIATKCQRAESLFFACLTSYPFHTFPDFFPPGHIRSGRQVSSSDSTSKKKCDATAATVFEQSLWNFRTSWDYQ